MYVKRCLQIISVEKIEGLDGQATYLARYKIQDDLRVKLGNIAVVQSQLCKVSQKTIMG